MKDKGILRRLLLGLGLDCADGIARVTRGPNYRLYGGSEETHEEMHEKAIKLNEKLRERKKTLDTVSREEFMDIAERIELFRKKES
ncbi:MAG: hypothetical protein PHN82_07420 [bacterium]|nr:hypothetical protein [bacterium]